MADIKDDRSGFNIGNHMGTGSSADRDTGEGFQPSGKSGMGSGAQAGGISGMASKAGEKLMDAAEQQKSAGADFVSGMADAIRSAAGSFDNQVPQAGEYIRYAADHVADMSDALRRRDIRQLVSGVETFARQQPTAFLGLTFLAGFAAVRFLRSSSPGAGAAQGFASGSSYDGMRDQRGSEDYTGNRPGGAAWPQSNPTM